MSCDLTPFPKSVTHYSSALYCSALLGAPPTTPILTHPNPPRHTSAKPTRAQLAPLTEPEYGQAAWDASDETSAHVTYSDAQVAHEAALRTLDNGFFRVRWERATPAERDYLKAMAIAGDEGSSSGEVAGRRGKKNTALGPIRANPISKGLVYAPEHGRIAFTVPRMADFSTGKSTTWRQTVVQPPRPGPGPATRFAVHDLLGGLAGPARPSPPACQAASAFWGSSTRGS